MDKKLAFVLVALLVSALILVGNAVADVGDSAKAASEEEWNRTFGGNIASDQLDKIMHSYNEPLTPYYPWINEESDFYPPVYEMMKEEVNNRGNHRVFDFNITLSSNTIYNAIYVPDNYSTIKEAVNAANAGDTIIVRSGFYHESVVLNKMLALIGDGMPTISAHDSDCIAISANHCIVKGFKCINAPYYNSGIELRQGAVWNIIANNTCEYNGGGITLLGRNDNNTISNNTIHKNGDNGIYIGGSENNTISNNEITYSNYNDVYSYDGYGIYMSGSTNNTIINNKITENKEEGIYIEGSSNNRFVDNVISRNNDNGVSLSTTYYRYSKNNTLEAVPQLSNNDR